MSARSADALTLTTLMHLASPALPIGGYSYSQGLEAAVDAGLVVDEATAGEWITAALEGPMAGIEAPLWVLQHANWAAGDDAALAHWNHWFVASRETAELRWETEQMGWSLAGLLGALDWIDGSQRARLATVTAPALPTVWALAIQARGIAAHEGVLAYLFAWAENQVAAAVKLVPLGQTAGQRILIGLHAALAGVATLALDRAGADPPELGACTPQLGLLSARHENQYSRLFRS